MVNANSNSSASKLSILSWNVRGLCSTSGRNGNTRAKKLQHILKLNKHINILCETKLSEKHMNKIRNQAHNMSYRVYENNNGHMRGVMVLVTLKKAIAVNVLHKTDDGNAIILEIEHDNQKMILVGIYGPSTDEVRFYENLFDKVESYNNNKIIVAGDLNLTIDPNNETYNYVSDRNNVNSRARVKRFISDNNMADPFKYSLYSNPHYTWMKPNGTKAARLDRYLVSEEVEKFVSKYHRHPRGPSDHCPISIDVDYSNFKPGPGTWKIPTNLLHNRDYIKKTKEQIMETCARYKIHNNNRTYEEIGGDILRNFLNEKNWNTIWDGNFKILPNDMLDIIINDIKNFTQVYIKNQRNNTNNVKNIIHQKLEENQANLDINPTDLNARIIESQLKTQYELVLEEETNRQLYKTSLLDIIKGDRVNATQCKIDKNIATQRYISKLIKRIPQQDGTVLEIIIENQDEIDEIIRAFYTDLYASKNDQITIRHIEDFLPNTINTKKLTDQDREELESPITLEELTATLKRSKSSSSPGPSGLSFLWYKQFWDQIKHLMLKVATDTRNRKQLPTSQSYGTICLLPKGDKNKYYIENWRPLTMLSCAYKLMSGSIAKRINDKLDKIIHKDQNGFVPGRVIQESLRNTADIIKHYKKLKKTGILLLIDFKKALDSISHEYITKVLDFFGFG